VGAGRAMRPSVGGISRPCHVSLRLRWPRPGANAGPLVVCSTTAEVRRGHPTARGALHEPNRDGAPETVCSWALPPNASHQALVGLIASPASCAVRRTFVRDIDHGGAFGHGPTGVAPSPRAFAHRPSRLPVRSRTGTRDCPAFKTFPGRSCRRSGHDATRWNYALVLG